MDVGGARFESKKMKYVEFEEERAKPSNLRSRFCSEGELTKNILSTLDLNAKSNHLPFDDSLSCIEDTNNSGRPQESESTKIFGKPRKIGFDLNSEDVSSSFNHEPLSECGSTCGSMGEKSSMLIWKQMKQNGFLSSSDGGMLVPPLPKPRGRKRGHESLIKKRIEIAKKEQVDKFAKVAAPSGLLNELNPGIINHVRNRKQVHSIIENLVRSARHKNKKNEHKQDNETSYYPNKECEDDMVALKLSSASTMASENISSLSNEVSANMSTVGSLSIKAARVASQWLELVLQDLKGRLAALRRSKKRVQVVTQTELPFLISRDLSSCNQENNPFAGIANNESHRLRWTTLFYHMDKSLSEEEKNLEESLNQVRELLLHCEHGLLPFPPANGFEINSIYSKAEPSLDNDLAVRAAAAAIYSTSNFLQSSQNLPCF